MLTNKLKIATISAKSVEDSSSRRETTQKTGKTGSDTFEHLSEAIEKASWKMTEKFNGFLKLIPGYVEQTGKDADEKTKNGLANVGASVANGKIK